MGDRADRTRRFRHLEPSSASKAGEHQPRGTADLFAHFGVEIERAPVTELIAAVEAAACRGCGWLLAYRRNEPSCPMCGDPEPLLSTPASP